MRLKNSWKQVGLLLWIVMVGLGLAALSEAQAPRVDVAYNALPFNLPCLVEQNQKFLAQEGYDVHYHSFGAGHAMTEAMAAGSLDIAPVMGATSTIVSKAGGRDIKIIGSYSQAPSAFALAVRPGSITLSDLYGKKIAAPIGTEVHVLLGKILAEQGLTLRDIELVNLLIPDGIAALQSGQVDATMVVEPVMSRLLRNGAIEILRDGEDLISGLTFSVTTTRLFQSAEVEAYKQVHARSLAYIEENLEEVLELAATELNLPIEIVEAVAEKYTFSAELTAKHLAELEETIAFLYKEGLIRRSIAVDDLL